MRNEGKNVKRNSSIEMVRIIAMMFIIMGHLAGHGILKVTTAYSFDLDPIYAASAS